MLPTLYLAAFIDAAGLGLISPILPTVLRHLTTPHTPITLHYGALIAAYALAQFLAAPALGVASDRFGRRPVLLLSLAGGAIDFLVTGFAPTLAILYIGRAVGGLTAANLSVISATIADLSDDATRTRRFATLNATLGIGWVAGPALGGMLGARDPHLPFVAAAILTAANLALALTCLPDTGRTGTPTPFTLRRLNSFAALAALRRLPGLVPLLAVFATLTVLGQVPNALWVIYGQFRFGWSVRTVGWSISCYGALFALAQATLAAPATRRLGPARTLGAGIAAEALANVAMGLARAPWLPFAIMPLYAAGGIGVPALQDGMARAIGPARQGELQGALASIMSLAAVGGPLLATAIFAATRDTSPGAVWLIVAVGYVATAAYAALRTPLHSPRDPAPPLADPHENAPAAPRT